MRSIPVIVLGGSDLRPGSLPLAAAGLHPLSAYKGAAVRVEGRPIVALLVERLLASAELGPIAIAGPQRVYRGLARGAHVIDTDGSLDRNLRAGVDAFLARFDAGPLALASCDILPDPAELSSVLEEYRRAPPSALWFPLVRAPLERGSIGAFGWKPSYPIAPERGAQPVDVLPGHFGILDPRELRLDLLYRLLAVAYRTRNRPLGRRRVQMLRALLGGLLREDLSRALSLRAPTFTFRVARAGLAVARQLRRRELSIPELERLTGRMVLRSTWRRRHPESGVRLPLVDALGFAEDIDTEEEARWIAERRAEAGAPAGSALQRRGGAQPNGGPDGSAGSDVSFRSPAQ